MQWDPGQYLKGEFGGLRLRPGLDLINAIQVEAPKRIIDLGCGTGTLAGLLQRRFPQADLIGLDASDEMLEKARSNAPEVRFEKGDIRTWLPAEKFDVIFSNAALHWLDRHEELFPQLLDRLNPGGVLAVQMPRNHQAASHQAIFDTVEAGPWAEKLRPLMRERPTAPPQDYYDILAPLAAGLTIWETEYLQVLEGEDPVFEWTRGTALRPYLQALDEADGKAFAADYAARLRKAYPQRADGRTLFPFRRLFLTARAGGQA